jgi:hypothetical protein
MCACVSCGRDSVSAGVGAGVSRCVCACVRAVKRRSLLPETHAEISLAPSCNFALAPLLSLSASLCLSICLSVRPSTSKRCR